MSDLGREVVTRKARTTGGGIDPVVTAAGAEKFEGCQVYPTLAKEADGSQSTTITGMTALIPDLSADILSSDRLEWRGGTFEVIGEPGPWRFMDGDDAALQVNMRKVSG